VVRRYAISINGLGSPILGLPAPRNTGIGEKRVRNQRRRLLTDAMSRNSARESLFGAWLGEYGAILSKVTRSFARTPVDAADLRQEIQLQLWNSLASYSGHAKASTWIYRVCLNTALTWRRGLERREGRIERGVDVGRIAGQSASPADSAGERELLDKLYAAIHAMDGFNRVLVLLSLDGLAYREIAEITGLTENNVGVALTRARRRLAELMKEITDELE
jgi:RNA polymerase sigma-70 factor (ECF subfamily)